MMGVVVVIGWKIWKFWIFQKSKKNFLNEIFFFLGLSFISLIRKKFETSRKKIFSRKKNLFLQIFHQKLVSNSYSSIQSFLSLNYQHKFHIHRIRKILHNIWFYRRIYRTDSCRIPSLSIACSWKKRLRHKKCVKNQKSAKAQKKFQGIEKSVKDLVLRQGTGTASRNLECVKDLERGQGSNFASRH